MDLRQLVHSEHQLSSDIPLAEAATAASVANYAASPQLQSNEVSRQTSISPEAEVAGVAALLSMSPASAQSLQYACPAPTNPTEASNGPETIDVPDILVGQLVKTHFGGSGRHYEPIKPWRETVAALRAGQDPASALHRTIAHNTSFLRTYFAKVDACPEEHDASETCLGACLGQPHRHGYICRFCGMHVSSDLHQFKWGPGIRHFNNQKCTLPLDEVELLVKAVGSLDTQYIESYQRAEERHAERYAASKGKKATGKAKARKTAKKASRAKSDDEDVPIPSSSKNPTPQPDTNPAPRRPVRVMRARPVHVAMHSHMRAKLLLDDHESESSARSSYADSQDGDYVEEAEASHHESERSTHRADAASLVRSAPVAVNFGHIPHPSRSLPSLRQYRFQPYASHPVQPGHDRMYTWPQSAPLRSLPVYTPGYQSPMYGYPSSPVEHHQTPYSAPYGHPGFLPPIWQPAPLQYPHSAPVPQTDRSSERRSSVPAMPPQTGASLPFHADVSRRPSSTGVADETR